MTDSAEPKLRFLARGTALVPDYGALKQHGRRAFHGWQHDPTKGPEFEDPVTKEKRRHGAFVRRANHVVTIEMNDPHVVEYIRHLRDGDLWPADAHTAQYARRPFDPTFGDEHVSVESTPTAASAAAAE